MKLKVKVQVIGPVRQGVSAASGYEWKNQDIVVTWPETLADGREVNNYQLVTLRGEMVERFAQLGVVVGAVIDADIAFGTRQHNDKVYNNNEMFV